MILTCPTNLAILNDFIPLENLAQYVTFACINLMIPISLFPHFPILNSFPLSLYTFNAIEKSPARECAQECERLILLLHSICIAQKSSSRAAAYAMCTAHAGTPSGSLVIIECLIFA